MKFKLCIEGSGEGGAKIDITDPDVITAISIKISQNDKSTNDRSDQLFGDLVIKGSINENSAKEIKKIFEWSKKTDKASVYKIVAIQVFSNDTELLRDYYLKDIYCTSYQESFVNNDTNDNDGTFELVMRQKKGSLHTIKVE